MLARAGYLGSSTHEPLKEAPSPHRLVRISSQHGGWFQRGRFNKKKVGESLVAFYNLALKSCNVKSIALFVESGKVQPRIHVEGNYFCGHF